MTRKSDSDTINSVATLLGGMLIVTTLYVARDVFIPLTLAILLSFLLSPVVNRIQRLGVGNAFAVLGTAICVFVLLAGTLTFVGRELSGLVSDVPHYKSELVSKTREIAGLRSGMGERFEELTKEFTAAIGDPAAKTSQDTQQDTQQAKSQVNDEKNQAEQRVLSPMERLADRFLPREQKANEGQVHDGRNPNAPLYIASVNGESPLISWAGTVGTILGPLGTAGLVTVFVLFLLIYRDDMRDRIIKIISHGDYVTTTDALDEVSRRISKYLVAQTIVNVSYGLTLAIGLYFIGRSLAPDGIFPNFLLWGAMATMLRFVPYIGPVVAASFPLLLSVAVFPGYSITIAVLSLIVVIELSSNNVIEPWLYGTSTGLSSVAIIFAAVFWGWLWGPVGLLLSTPLTVCLVVLGHYVPRFRMFSTLLGEKVDIAPSLLFYQRLLSNNHIRATELLESCIKDEGTIAIIDHVLVPTLRRVQQDLDEDRLTSVQASGVSTAFAKVVGDMSWLNKGEVPAVTEGGDDATPKINVLVIPSHHPSEELLLAAFAKAFTDLSIQVGSNNTLPDRFAVQALRDNPDAIVIYVLPNGGFTQARFICRAIRNAGYKGPIVACCSGKFRNFDRLFVKFRKAGANFMTTGFVQTAQKLSGLRNSADKRVRELAPQL